jgi:hypothetical protein
MPVAFLIAQQRSGTAALGSILDQHPEISFLGERFHDGEMHNPGSYFAFLVGRVKESAENSLPTHVDQNFSAYLEHLESLSPKEVKVVDIKYNSTHHFDRVWKSLNERPGLLTLARERNIPIVHLTRRNHLKCLVSLRNAERSNLWHVANGNAIPPGKVSLDKDQVVGSLDFYAREQETMSRFLGGHERLATHDYDAVFDVEGGLTPDVQSGLARLLEVSEFQSWRASFAKQTSDSLSQVLENYSEIVEVLTQTPYAWMLDPGASSDSGEGTQPRQSLIASLREKNDRLGVLASEAQRSLAWIEARAADLQFEVKSTQARLLESQAVRKLLESQLESQSSEVLRLKAEIEKYRGPV